MTESPRAVIRLDALRTNFELISQAAAGSRVIAVVKANAYGHGLLPVARELQGADCLAVARLVEAQRLRKNGVDTPILLLSGVADRTELELAAELRCDLVVHSAGQVALVAGSGRAIERVWLKVDTGMHRLGIAPADVPGCVADLRAGGSAEAVGLMTHMANADDPGDAMNRRQLEAFAEVTKGFDGDVSVANSALVFSLAEEFADPGRWGNRGTVWVRPGIALYGISPFARRAVDGLQPVMRLETRLLDVKPMAAGEAVGYGGTWSAERDTRLGIAAIGYGDGYPRHLPSGSPVLVGGRRAALAGAVSMDLLAIDLGPDAQATAGERVVLWGDGLPVEEVARCAGTIPYTLVTGVAERVTRSYEGTFRS